MAKPDKSKLIFRESAQSLKPEAQASGASKTVGRIATEGQPKAQSQKPKPGVPAQPERLPEPEAKARSHTAESGYGADPGAEHWKDCADEVGGFVLKFNAELINRLVAIDKNIVEYGKLLNDSQPGAAGKILVRWWKTGARGRAGGTTPVFMVMSRNRSGRLSGKRLDQKNITKKAKSSHNFAINHKPTVEILETLANLFEMRAKIFSDIGRLKRVLSAMKAKDGNLSYIAARSQILGRQISKNLYKE